MSKKKFNRYHDSIYFPETFSKMMVEFIQTLNDEIDLTNHAAEALFEDKRGDIPLPTKKELLDNTNKIVEFYERTDRLGRIQKAVFRVSHLSEKYDYTYVVARGGVVVTAWANDKGDNHRLTHALNEYIQDKKDDRLNS